MVRHQTRSHLFKGGCAAVGLAGGYSENGGVRVETLAGPTAALCMLCRLCCARFAVLCCAVQCCAVPHALIFVSVP